VPCLNQGRFLAEALDSVIKQKYPNLEIIVADGGSSDNSKEVINVYKQHIYLWKSEPDNGQSAAINWGMAQSTGEILCWLNSDDLFCDNALLLVGTAAAQHPECGLYIGNGLRRDLTGSLRPFCPHPLAFNRDVLRLGGPYVHQPSTFFRRAAWMGTGGLDAELGFAWIGTSSCVRPNPIRSY
jgi:glycosyltransferase involved in cell wall biosynthesis